jgi:hypothetical protein
MIAPDSTAPEGDRESQISVPFGAENRERLLGKYFATAGKVTPQDAWLHIYKLLLWIDPTTGLAHCYESDKAQPGRLWYARSLAFHAWLADVFDVNPNELGEQLDWLFKQVINDVAKQADSQSERAAERGRSQLEGFGDREMPRPGSDPELMELIRAQLAHRLAAEPTDDEWWTLTEKVRAHLKNENKRKNLVGEGFEDSVHAILTRLPQRQRLLVRTRQLIEDIPEFSKPAGRDKEKRVDLVIVNQDTGLRTLASAKWSVRADREEQLASDYIAYAGLNRGAPFDYVFLTNEFDPARLVAACDRIHANHPVFKRVVHINPEGLLAAYGKGQKSFARIPDCLTSRRLISLSDWLAELTV